MTVSPHVEGEMGVDTNNMANEFVRAERGEVGEVSHIMKLDEEAYDVEGVHCPAQHLEVEVDKCNCQQLIGDADEDS